MEASNSSSNLNESEKNNEGDFITMVDVLKEEQDMEEDAAAVLGGSDEKHCTYEKGYVKRQALYSCMTCVPDCKEDPNKAIAVCLACSFQCHEKHELIELYTKRLVRCDCGLKGSSKCNLAVKTEENKNKYNQNFTGVYCICKRPYPDPSDPVPDEMIQCIICEDWYHGRHLKTNLPSMDTFSEMICGMCMDKNEFLKNYTGLSHLKPNLEDTVNGNESLLNITANDSIIENPKQEDSEEKQEPPVKRMKLDESAETSSSNSCTKPLIKIETYRGGATFWPENWRQHLCKCSTCLELYKSLEIEFLPDPEDTVHYYEEKGKTNVHKTAFARGMEALSSLDRTRQIDAISEYNKMMEKLKEYLHSFVVNRQIVTEEDINRFFRTMKNERPEPIGMPQNFCR